MTAQQQLSRKMAKLGKKGGLATRKKKGSKFFAKISRMRKHRRGGRKPNKKSNLTLEALDG